MKIKWNDVQFEDKLSLELRIKLLEEYLNTGKIQGYFLSPVEGQSTDPNDAYDAGIKPNQIDWTDFPQQKTP